MTQQQIILIQNSWLDVKSIATEAGLLFYNKLFEAAPEIRHLFKEDVTPQANKLMSTLGFVVAHLNKLDTILHEVKKVGEKHNAYGARPEHYAVVGQCLIATLKEGLQEKWNSDLEEAWLQAYTVVQNVMIEAQAAALQSNKQVLEV